MCDCLQPHRLQHARLPCPSSTPGACSNSCPSSQWCHPTISTCCSLLLLPSILPTIRVFSNELDLCTSWPKYWSFSFTISPSNEYSGLISFRMDWLDLLAVQGTLKSLLQHHSSKVSILGHSAFFMVQLSHPYTTTGKTIALKNWQYQGLTRMWSNWHFHKLLVEKQNHMATLENNLEISYKVNYTLSTWSSNPAPSKMKVIFTQKLAVSSFIFKPTNNPSQLENG